MRINNTTSAIAVILLVFAAVGCAAQGTSGPDTYAADTAVDAEGSFLETSGLFTDRDLEQTVDFNDAVSLEPASGSATVIEEEGIYLLSGSYSNSTIVVDADDDAKVQLVLENLVITNDNLPAIYVKSGDKVFITTTGSSILTVTGEYLEDGDTNLDAVIFSRSDLVFNGTGELEIVSEYGNGISGKDDLKITGGILVVDARNHGLEANDSIRISDGDITIEAGEDALHSENDDDARLGYIYIRGGSLAIEAGDDGIRGNSIVQVDGGVINIENSQEGIEATQVQINGGTLDIYATDDGINATAKTDIGVMLEVNGGDITIVMANGDTDAFDSNGDLYIYGGNIDVTAGSSFDADGTALLIGGTVTINGEVVTELPEGRGPGRGGQRKHG